MLIHLTHENKVLLATSIVLHVYTMESGGVSNLMTDLLFLPLFLIEFNGRGAHDDHHLYTHTHTSTSISTF